MTLYSPTNPALTNFDMLEDYIAWRLEQEYTAATGSHDLAHYAVAMRLSDEDTTHLAYLLLMLST